MLHRHGESLHNALSAAYPFTDFEKSDFNALGMMSSFSFLRYILIHYNYILLHLLTSYIQSDSP